MKNDSKYPFCAFNSHSSLVVSNLRHVGLGEFAALENYNASYCHFSIDLQGMP